MTLRCASLSRKNGFSPAPAFSRRVPDLSAARSAYQALCRRNTALLLDGGMLIASAGRMNARSRLANALRTTQRHRPPAQLAPSTLVQGGNALRSFVTFLAPMFAAGGCCGAWHLHGRQEHGTTDEVVLPQVVEPCGHYVHPYDAWPWHRRAWFAVKRAIYLAWVFTPFMCVSVGLCLFPDYRSSGPWRDYWLELMLQCTQRAGVAFQKIGQVMSMRPDMLPPDVVEVLGRLRSQAPSHSGEISKQTLRENLGREVEDLFDAFQDEPVASGSVGQVHRAHLKAEFALDGPGGQLRDVAVKVQHPGVVESAFMDLSIVWTVFELSKVFLHMTIPFARVEFEESIQTQMDFTREAFNLQRFSQNFRGDTRISFPKVSQMFLTPEVLIETWADGQEITHFLEDFDNSKATQRTNVIGPSSFYEAEAQRHQLQRSLCSTVYDMTMKMMVRDNFVHGDLHSGNILYSEADNKVTVLDAGVTTHLDRQTLRPFGSFLHALCSGNADGVVEHLQRFDESSSEVNVAELRRDIREIMDRFHRPLRASSDLPCSAADIYKEVLYSVHKHQMVIKGDVASTLYTMCISEGLMRQLDPNFDVATRALPYIARYGANAGTSRSN